MTRPPLVLASTSRYRRELLTRLVSAFSAVSPGVEESALPGETPAALAARLAADKARAVAGSHPQAVVIGSDQVAELDGMALGKPGQHAAARRQLADSSGREVVFHTAVHLVVPGSPDRRAIDRTTVRFRTLSSDEIEQYLIREQPYDCAGSFKCEALGIALFDAINSSDPTALIGLPLIATARLLREAGIDPLLDS